MLESDILHVALEHLKGMVQAEIEVMETSGVNGHRWDAEIDIAAGAAKGHFKVEVKGISVVNTKGKAKRFGKSNGRRDNIRKAYVTLKPGQELNLGGEAA